MTKPNFSLGVDDVLFAIALIVPLVCGAARFVDSERKLEVIAQAQKKAAAVAQISEARIAVAKR